VNLELPINVKYGSTQTILIKCSPVSNNNLSGILTIKSNDPQKRKLKVTLTAIGKNSSNSPNIEAIYKKADNAYDNKNYNLAISLYSEIIKNDPKQPKAYYLRGLSKHGANKFREAIKDFDLFISKYAYEMGENIDEYQCRATFFTAICYGKLYQQNAQDRDKEKAIRNLKIFNRECSSVKSEFSSQNKYWREQFNLTD
jgi:tetratricopeptide (TPR) repeat protein